MEAMQTSVSPEVLRNAGRFRRQLGQLVAVAIAATIGLAASPAFAQCARSATAWTSSQPATRSPAIYRPARMRCSRPAA
jgi:hypothetical protein